MGLWQNTCGAFVQIIWYEGCTGKGASKIIDAPEKSAVAEPLLVDMTCDEIEFHRQLYMAGPARRRDGRQGIVPEDGGTQRGHVALLEQLDDLPFIPPQGDTVGPEMWPHTSPAVVVANGEAEGRFASGANVMQIQC